MSSSYSFVCMNHDPGIEIAGDFSSGDVERGTLEVTLAGVRGIHHPDCDLVIARESGAIIEVACLAPMGVGHGHAIPRWVEVDLLRLVLQARQAAKAYGDAGLTAALSRHFDASRCWPDERIRRLRGIVDLEPWDAK